MSRYVAKTKVEPLRCNITDLVQDEGKSDQPTSNSRLACLREPNWNDRGIYAISDPGNQATYDLQSNRQRQDTVKIVLGRPPTNCATENAEACRMAPTIKVEHPSQILRTRPNMAPEAIAMIAPKKHPRSYVAVICP